MMKPETNKVGEPRTCVECGKEFIPQRTNVITCSRGCNRRRNNQKKREWFASRRPTYEDRSCVICGATFKPKTHRSLTCSTPCSRQWRNTAKPKQVELGGRKYPYDGRSEANEVDELRRREGLPLLKRGIQTCSCGKKFPSDDLTREHMCSSCRARAEGIYLDAGARHQTGQVGRRY